MAIGWTLVVIVAVMATSAVIAMVNRIDLGAAYWIMSATGTGRLYTVFVSLAAIPGQIAVAMWATRFIVRGEMPRGLFEIPDGAGAYFGYSLVIGLIVFLLVLISFPISAFVGAHAPWVCGSAPPVASLTPCRATVWWVAEGVLAFGIYYLVARAWLVFPAIALGDEMSLAKSFSSTRGSVLTILVGPPLIYFPFLAAAVGLGIAVQFALPYDGSIARLVLALVVEGITAFLIFLGIMAAAAFLGLVYAEIVPGNRGGS